MLRHGVPWGPISLCSTVISNLRFWIGTLGLNRGSNSTPPHNKQSAQAQPLQYYGMSLEQCETASRHQIFCKFQEIKTIYSCMGKSEGKKTWNQHISCCAWKLFLECHIENKTHRIAYSSANFQDVESDKRFLLWQRSQEFQGACTQT